MTTEQITLKIESRENTEKNSILRDNGFVPAVFYGADEEAVSIKISENEFEKVWKSAGESTIITLSGIGDDKEALIKSVQWHPLKDNPMHVDFYIIQRGHKLSVNVPFEFVGEAPAEKLGGNVNKAMHEVEIEAKPKDIPQHIEVDLTKLEQLDSVITIADLNLPKDIEVKVGSDDVVASIVVAKEEVEEAPAESEGENASESTQQDESSSE